MNKMWLSKGLIVSSKRMQILINLKRTFTLLREGECTKKYKRIYKRVLKETKKERDNDRYVIESMDKTKALWKLINREIGKAPENDHMLELRIGNKIISNPSEITEKLNMHCISTVEELVKQNNNERSYNNLQIKHCPNSIFVHPVTEEVISLTKSLKGEPTAGYDGIHERLVT